MRSHFSIGSRAAMACAVSGATAMLTSLCSGQVALDVATDPAYAGGWSAGQNGGYGFGPWSFNGTQAPDNSFVTSGQQGMSSSSPLGTSWTLFNLSTSAGLATAGRSLAPLAVGQTLETVIDNPTTTQFFRGWTISFNSGNDNIYPGGSQYNPSGDTGLAQVQAYHFEYFNYGQWTVGDLSGNTGATLYNTDTAVAGVKLDLTLTSATTYSLTMTPLGGSASPYTQTGSLANGGPIDWIQYQLYNQVSGGLNDTANNFEVSYIEVIPEPSTLALIGFGSAGLLFLRRRK